MRSDEPKETVGLLGVIEVALDATQAAFVEGKTSVWDYSNPEHFNALWKCLEDGSINGARRILIVWSKTPIDDSLLPVNAAEHVSPLHWAACAAKAAEIESERKAKQSAEERLKVKSPDRDCIQEEVEAEGAQMQMCILDLNPVAHQGQYLYKHYLSCDKWRLPWLRVFQAAHLFGIEAVDGRFEADTLPVESKSLFGRLFPQFESKRSLVGASHFVDRIRNELTSPQNAENRHAISNIIGPMILRSGRSLTTRTSGIRFIKNGIQAEFPSAAKSEAMHRWALNTILQAANLMSAELVDAQGDEQAHEESAGWLGLNEECSEAGLNPAELRITLVDDQWSQGWLAWVKEGLGPTPIELQVSPDPDFLLKLLGEVDCERRPFSLSLTATPSGPNHSKQDILLLDLRLFTSNATAEQKFATDLKKLLIAVARGQNAPDRQRFRGDLAVVERRLQMLNGADVRFSSEEQARYVTILPRLIASTDFSLPIIVFSSTGQREVLVEPFEKYPSIITTFSKPRHFQGENENVVVNTEAALAEAFVRAIRWVRGRKLVQQIQSRPLTQLENTRKRCAGYTHYELYFDESGIPFSPRFRCAALLVGYVGGDKDIYANDAVVVHRQMEAKNLIWYPAFPGAVKKVDYLDKDEKNEPRENRWLADKQWNDKVAEPLAAILDDRPAIPFAISRTRFPYSTSEPDDLDLAHPDALDNIYTDLIQLLLEMILIDVLPTIAGDLTKLTLHIYGATRLKNVPLNEPTEEAAKAEARALWRRFKDKYGFQDDVHLPKRWFDADKYKPEAFYLLYRSLLSDAMLPLLARALSARPYSPHAKLVQEAVKCAICVMLTDQFQPESTVRHQHYVCDRLAHICDVDANDDDLIDLRVLNSWPPFVETGIGFLGRRNQVFLNLIDCGRFLDAKDSPNAFALGGAVITVEGLLPEAITSRLKLAIPTLTAEQFEKFCGLLSSNAATFMASTAPADRFAGQTGEGSRGQKGVGIGKATVRPRPDQASKPKHGYVAERRTVGGSRPGLETQAKSFWAKHGHQHASSSGVAVSPSLAQRQPARLMIKGIPVQYDDPAIRSEIAEALKECELQGAVEVEISRDIDACFAFMKVGTRKQGRAIMRTWSGQIRLFGRFFHISYERVSGDVGG